MSTVRLAIVCSGQAGQRREMLDGVLGSPDVAELCRTAGALLGNDLETWWRNLDNEAIFINENAQFAIAFYQLATWQRIRHLIPEPSLIAGYSLGEVTAYHVAGALDAPDTLRLVSQRSRAMNAASSEISTTGGCMLLWRGRMSETAERAVVENSLDVAIVRRTGERVFAGPANSIDAFMRETGIDNPSQTRLQISTPSHSHYLATAAASFRTILEESGLHTPTVPVLAGINGMRIRTREQAIGALSGQIDTTIRWDRCMDALEEAGITSVLELGPGSDLANLIGMEHPRISARSIDDFGDWRSVAGWLRDRGHSLC